MPDAVDREMTPDRRRRLAKRFEEQEAALLLSNCRRAAFLGAVFALGGIVLDLVVYGAPRYWDLLWAIVQIRFWGSLVLLGLLAMLYIPRLQPEPVRVVGHLIALTVILALNLILVEIGTGGSPYYAGLNLVMVGAVLILRWRFSDGVINSVLCIGSYLLVATGLGTPGNDIVVAAFFLFVTAVFACVGLYYYNRIRFGEFCLREAVIEQQEKLAENHRRLQELDEAKTRFFANISHELRTPLTLILAPIEKLRSSKAVRRDANLAGMVDSLEDNGMRLLRLINDLLDLVRLDRGGIPLRPERFDLAGFIDGLGRNLASMAERKRIDLTWAVSSPDGTEVVLDRDRLEKIVLNLAVNAIKFTPPEGKVSVGAALVGGRVEIVVSDTGAGMDEQQMRAAFERFWQADSSIRRKHSGVGIGLALVKSLTESLDGRVEVESERDVGTTFTVSIPVPAAPGDVPSEGDGSAGAERTDPIEEIYQRARLQGMGRQVDEEPERAPGGLPEGADNTRVLVVDDEAGLRRFLRGELESMGCVVVEARDGAEGWELARRRPPDLAILDLMMPELDGIALTRRLRWNEETRHLPIILLTAHADDSARLKALEAGVTDFLTKPFTTAELRVRIRNLLDRQSYQRRLSVKNRELESALREIRENEMRLLQAEKLSSLGRMSAGIVHEVNNPLNYAKSAIHTVKVFADDIASDERQDFLEMVGDIEEGVDRVIQIVSDLRAFTRGQTIQREPVVVADVVELSRRLLSRDLKGIDFEVSVPEGVEIDGNRNQLCQVFVNLIQNAAQSHGASREAGRQPRVWIDCRQERDRSVRITIGDNGKGIQPEDLEHIFDPFFTKREVGEGMGLGLSICHRIVDSHGGGITVRSSPGERTEFLLSFPPPSVDEEEEAEENEEAPLIAMQTTTSVS